MEPRKTAIHYVDHCDDASCGLGYAIYICAWCLMKVQDYGHLWWNRYERAEVFKCEECMQPLIRDGY